MADGKNVTASPREGVSSYVDTASVLPIFARLLGARLYLHTWIRLFVAFLIVLGSLFAKYVIHITELNVPALIVLACVIAAYNSVAWYLTRSLRTPEQSLTSYRLLTRILYSTIILDFLCLTVGVWLVGGARSPFLGFYLLHLILSSILLSRRSTLFILAFAYTLLIALVLSEWLHFIPVNTPIGAIAGPCVMDGRFALTVIIVYGILFGLTVFLLTGISDVLRSRTIELRKANTELERLSSMRRDFLHIALHDLKAPVAAVKGMLDNLHDGLLGELNEKQTEWIERSLKRLDGLDQFLLDLQTLASLEDDNLDEHMATVDVCSIVQELVEENQDLARAKNHTLTVQCIKDGVDSVKPVHGVSRLIREAILNYITNAIKYTPDGGTITVRCISKPCMIRIEVEDTGIGMTKDDQARLFKEFVRLRHQQAVKASGTGLGLSIVQRIVNYHGGRTLVHSEPGKGSTFIIELPVMDVCWLPSASTPWIKDNPDILGGRC